MQRLTNRPLQAALVSILLVFLAGDALAGSARFRRGDVNQDGRLDTSDPIYTLQALFLGGPQVTCDDAADANDDGSLDISDPLYTLLHLFVGGPGLAAPAMTCGLDPTEDGLDCASYPACPVLTGQDEFVTPLDGAPGGNRGGLDGGDVLAGGAPPEQNAPPAPEAGETEVPDRLIEEADLYKLVGTDLFVLNRYRGLQILDLSDLDAPRLVGRAPVYGYPREMYVRGNTAYVIVSDYYSYWRDETAGSAVPGGFFGSQLRIIDISDATHPVVVGGINLEGDCSDSRIVGDVMYLVSHRYPWYGGYLTNDTEDMTQIISVQVGDPEEVKVIDTKDFPRNGWEHHIMVNAKAIYLASSGYDRESQSYETRIRYVDIRDPAGTIIVRDEAEVPGRVQDRWAMDEYENVLRVASGKTWGNGDVYLTTYSVENPDAIRKLGSYTLYVAERLTSARFDGKRGYLVSYRNIDPLFTFDLSDPAKPRLLGELEMSGWLDFIVPSGDRLIALGHEDKVDPETGSRSIRLAVSLIDVSSREKPELLSRVALDGLWGWVPGDRDDFAKVFKTLPSQGLILFPYRAWNAADYRYVGGVQLIDFDDATLTRRGLIRDAGWVERGIPYDEATVLTLSNEVFQVVDIADRDAPAVRGRLELARNVQDFGLLPGDHTVQLAGDWYRGDAELVVTPIDDPDTVRPVSSLHVGAPYGRMFVNGSIVYIASVQEEEVPGLEGEAPTMRRTTVVDVYDLTNPESPVARGSVKLPEDVWPGYHYWYWGWGDEVVQVEGSTLVFHRYRYPWIFWDCLECGGPVRDPGVEDDNVQKLFVVDLSDPDAPVVASTVEIAKMDWAWGLEAEGSMVYISSYAGFRDEENRWMARYYLSRIDVAVPASPEVHPAVNIPGMFVGAGAGTPYIYTLETWWDSEVRKSRSVLHALAIVDDKAHLQSSVEFEGYTYGMEIEGGAALTVTGWWEEIVLEGGERRTENHTDLVTVDLGDPQEIRLAGSAPIPYSYAYIREVEAGRAFLSAGPGIFTYRVDDLENPAFEKFFRTYGWTQDIVVRGERAYVPSGYYGVQVLDLAAGE